MTTYEVQKHGVTVEMSPSLRDAEDRFKKAMDGEVKLYRISGGVKHLLRQK